MGYDGSSSSSSNATSSSTTQRTHSRCLMTKGFLTFFGFSIDVVAESSAVIAVSNDEDAVFSIMMDITTSAEAYSGENDIFLEKTPVVRANYHETLSCQSVSIASVRFHFGRLSTRMSGGRFVLLLLLCGAVSLADKSPKGKGSSPSTEAPAVTGVSGVPSASSESRVLTTTDGVLSSTTSTASTSVEDRSKSTAASETLFCIYLKKNMSMETVSGCIGSTITFPKDPGHVLNLSGATQNQVNRLFSLKPEEYKKLTHSLLLQKSGIKALEFSVATTEGVISYVIKYNDELRNIFLKEALIFGDPVHVQLTGNKLLTQDVINAFRNKFEDKLKQDSYFQDERECTMKELDQLENFADLKDCQYFYKDLVINQHTHGTAPQRLPFSNISSGCLRIQGTTLTNLNFLTNLEKIDIDCPATDFNEITGNKELCLNSETKDTLMKKLGSKTKIENNLDCDDVCDAAWAQKKRNDDNIRCRKIVGDLVVTGVKDVADLEYLSEVVEIEGSLDIHHNSVNEFKFLSKLKKIKHGDTGVKTLLFIHGNTNLKSLDLRSLEKVTNHPDRDDVSWLVVEENSPRFLFSIEEAERLKKFGRTRADYEDEKPIPATAAPETTTSSSHRAAVYLSLAAMLF